MKPKKDKTKADQKKEKILLSGLEVDLKSLKTPEKEEVEEVKTNLNEKPKYFSENNTLSGMNVEFRNELTRLLRSRKSDIPEVFIGRQDNLERSIASSPRTSQPESDENKNYSDMKYNDDLYNENSYANKTPGAYSEKSSEPTGSAGRNSNSSSGNSNPEQ